MDEDTRLYVRGEIDHVLRGVADDDRISVKFYGDGRQSKWLRVTPDQVRAIRDLLTGDLTPNHVHTADCMDGWAEARRDIMTPQTIAANHRLHMGEAWNDERCPCGQGHTRAEHNYDPDKD